MKNLILIGHNRLTGVNTGAGDLATHLPADIYNIKDIYNKPIYEFKHNNIISNTPNGNKYDNIFVSYGNHLKLLTHYSGRVVFIKHGTSLKEYNYNNIYPCLYRSPDVTVGVSTHISEQYNCDHTIYNGIDLNFFKSNNKFATDVSWHSRYPVPNKLREISNEIHWLHKYSQKEILYYSWLSKYIFAIGRSALESMALNKPTFIGAGSQNLVQYGGWYSGWVSEHNYLKGRDYNFNGRPTCKTFDTINDIITEIENVPEQTNLRELVAEYNSIEYMVKKYKNII